MYSKRYRRGLWNALPGRSAGSGLPPLRKKDSRVNRFKFTQIQICKNKKIWTENCSSAGDVDPEHSEPCCSVLKHWRRTVYCSLESSLTGPVTFVLLVYMKHGQHWSQEVPFSCLSNLCLMSCFVSSATLPWILLFTAFMCVIDSVLGNIQGVQNY